MFVYDEKDNDLKLCGVYTITNIVTGKLYLGSTLTTFIYRWRKHYNSLIKGTHYSSKLQRAVNKYGIQYFKFEILDIVDSSIVRNIEQYWLTILDPIKSGYNSSYSVYGGCLGYKHSDTFKNNKSIDMIGNSLRLNKPHSDKDKLKISNSLKEFYINSENSTNIKLNARERIIKLNKTVNLLKRKKPIIQLNKVTGEEIKSWESAKDVERDLGFKGTTITAVCKGKRGTAYTFIWKYKK